MISLAVIGLGNPGSEYKNTRHNAGFMAVDFMQKKWGTEEFHEKKNLHGELCEATVGGTKILLFKPTTFMNLSAQAVAALTGFYNLDRSRCVVIYDDIDLPVGSLRIRASGSSGTHNGMRSICAAIGNDFPRIRLGIDGRTPEQKNSQNLADYVLGKFNKEERGVIDSLIEKTPDAIEILITEGIEKAMEKFNQ